MFLRCAMTLKRSHNVKYFKRQLGSYSLDIHKVKLEVIVKKDSTVYSKLHTAFKEDHTFQL